MGKRITIVEFIEEKYLIWLGYAQRMGEERRTNIIKKCILIEVGQKKSWIRDIKRSKVLYLKETIFLHILLIIIINS